MDRVLMTIMKEDGEHWDQYPLLFKSLKEAEDFIEECKKKGPVPFTKSTFNEVKIEFWKKIK